MSNLDFLTQSPEKPSIKLEDIILPENCEKDDILFVDEFDLGEKFLNFKKNKKDVNFSIEKKENLILEIKPEDLKTCPADKGKILLSNGVNWVPTLPSFANFLLISSTQKGEKRKTSHLSFYDHFNIDYINATEALISLKHIDTSSLVSFKDKAEHGDVLSFNKNLNKYVPIKNNSFKFCLKLILDFKELKSKESFNIKEIKKEENLLYVFYNVDIINQNLFPIISCTGCFNNFFYVKEIKPNFLIIEIQNEQNIPDNCILNLMLI